MICAFVAQQFPIPAPTGGSVFITVAGSIMLVGGIVFLILSIRSLLEPEPKRRVVSQMSDPASKADLLKLEHDFDHAIEGIHTRINTLAEEMPGKVIALLRDTGHLRWPSRDD